MPHYLYDTCRMTFLCVDDDAATRELMNTMLFFNYPNQKIRFAHNGVDAQIKIKKYDPDLLMLDLHMPFLDGFGLIEQIQNDIKKREIIVISGYTNDEVIEKCIKAGVSGFVSKPINCDYLFNCIHSVMERIFLQRVRASPTLNARVFSQFSDQFFADRRSTSGSQHDPAHIRQRCSCGEK